MELYHRIKSRRLELGLTQEELAEKMGYRSKTSINKIEMGKADIPQSKIIAFARALETTPAYLMGWSNEVPGIPADKTPIPAGENIIPLPKTYKVPLLGTIACGNPILAEENISDLIPVPDCIKNADFALRCQGDSMNGARIFDGDIVYIRQQPDVDDGDIAAVLIDGEAVLKRVYKMPGRLQLRTENPAFPAINLEGDCLQTVRILGKAVAFTSSVR